MCGIAGTISLSNQTETPLPVLRRMTDLLAHRGPDGSGHHADDHIAFGHRRLSIIDLSEGGAQPMSDAGGRFLITFNGEIYNFAEIRQRLAAKGYVFRSGSDTEVILNAFAEYGENCWEHFIGMFAFALHDRHTKTTWLFRDRLGIKPLYYAEFDGKLLFASEPKSILAYPGFKSPYRLQAVASYLAYRYPVGGQSMFEHIKPLLPGHLLKAQNGAYQTLRYYEPPTITAQRDMGEGFYIEKIRETLESAVKYRMIADVPVGAYLSGGLDSSIVTALMSQNSPFPVKTFTIGFAEEGYNEFAYARMVAERHKTEHHAFEMPAEQYFGLMQNLIRFKDAPLGVPNEPALYQMSAELKKHVTVVLSGEGADEIFGGYGRIFRSAYDYLRMQELDGFTEAPGALAELQKNLQKKYGAERFASPLDHFLGQYQYMKNADMEMFLSPAAFEQTQNDPYNREVFQTEFDKTEGMGLSERYMWVFEKLHLPGLLQRVDMTTMAASVEARVPFVDHRLVELAMSIPLKYKMKWNSVLSKALGGVCNSDQISELLDSPKHILKKSFEKDLPKEVVWRKKMGFPVPLHRWLGGGFRQTAHDILLSQKARGRGLYHIPNLEKALAKPELFEQHAFGLKIWMLVNLEMWFLEYGG